MLIAAPAAHAASDDRMARDLQQLQQRMQDPKVQDAMRQQMERAHRQQEQQAARGAGTTILVPASQIKRNLMSPAQLAEHVRAVQTQLMKRLLPEPRKTADALIARLKSQGPSAYEGVAHVLWLTGRQTEAAALMGQCAVERPGDPDCLNNFAAFLTMLSAPEHALPILLRLAADHPENATVLNNLGQAWWILGDKAEAEKYLRAAVRYAATHREANATLATLEESRGNKPAAIQALERSLQGGHGARTEKTLQRLGGQPPAYAWQLPVPPDALGFDRFALPPYCNNANGLTACMAQWSAFHRQLSAVKAELGRQRAQVGKTLVEWQKRQLAHPAPPAPLSRRAKASFDDAMARRSRLAQDIQRDEAPAREKLTQADERFKPVSAALWDTYRKRAEGGGKGEQAVDMCAESLPAKNEYLGDTANLWPAVYASSSGRVRRVLGDYAYFSKVMYGASHPMAQLAVLEAKQAYVTYLARFHPATVPGLPGNDSSKRCGNPSGGGAATYKLADFYDLHCDSIVTLSIPKLASWTLRCDREIYTWDIDVPVPGVSLGTKGEVKLDSDHDDRLVSGHIEAELGVKIGASKKLGPVSISSGAHVDGGVFIDLDETGISDVGTTIKAGASLGNISDGKHTLKGLGVESSSRWSWNTSSHTSTTWSLAGMKL